MTESLVTTETRDGVLICHIDDGKANALSASMIQAISDALDSASSDDDIHAVVLNGRDGKFSAGFDLSVMLGDDLDAKVDLVASGGELCRAIYSAPVPVVAACTGHALAAGALMLLSCDVRVGTDVPSKIGLNEVAIGMSLPGWALTLAGERLSRRHIQRAIPTARITDCAGAVDVGYLDEVVAHADVLDTALAHAQSFAELDARAYAVTIRALRGPAIDLMGEQIASDRVSRATVGG